jgi:glycosyltransferase involved in cell wall biosynthesis
MTISVAASDFVQSERPPVRVVLWGTYDVGKPRVRILLRGLRDNGVEVIECHKRLWTGVEDKSQPVGWATRLRLGLRWVFSYPRLVVRYLCLPEHDAVIVCYMGQLDVLAIWLFAKLRRKPVIWDAFLSLYNTVVEDRELVGRRHPFALGLYGVEWLACRAADRVVLDTAAHAAYFAATFHVPSKRLVRVFVGAETDVFRPREPRRRVSPGAAGLNVLFYGQFIPLHGIEYIVRAAKLCEDQPVHWTLIGKGQEEGRIRNLIAAVKPAKMEWIHWIPYPELPAQIAHADVCLGIFGRSDKAHRVIPNKVFQVLAMGKPLITMDSPAARELLTGWPRVLLIPPADPASLAAAVCGMLNDRPARSSCISDGTAQRLIRTLSPKCVTAPLADLLRMLTARGR